ncbi:hypothetical protein EL84_28910 [Paenibacillus sp. VT-400]|nr:hypothetical protein EL84_28910 [Paenibacillus sp. VT-400]
MNSHKFLFTSKQNGNGIILILKKERGAKSYMEALYNPAIALSGFVGTVILSLVATYSKLKKNPLRFFVSLEELQYMSSGMKLLRFLYLSFLLVVICGGYSVLLTSVFLNWINNEIMYIFRKVPSTLSYLFLLFSIVQLFSFQRVQSIISNWTHRKNTASRRKIVIPAFMSLIIIYMVHYSIFYGWLINRTLITQGTELGLDYVESTEIILSIKKFDLSTIFFLLVLTVVYFLLLLRIKNLFKYLGHSKISFDIKLKSGMIFSNKQILHIDLEKSYLISNSTNIFDVGKLLVPKDNIEYISSNNYYSSLGRETLIKDTEHLSMQNYNPGEISIINSIIKKNKIFNVK